HCNHAALRHLVTQLDAQLFKHTGVAGRNFHGGLVGLHGNQRLLNLDGVAHVDQHFDHANAVEIPDVRDLDCCLCHICVSGLYQAYRGLILSAWMPYLAIASATLVIGSLPSSARELSAASTM